MWRLERLVDGDGGAERRGGDAERGGDDERPEGERAEGHARVAGREARAEVGEPARPREHDGPERQVLLALEEEAHRRGVEEDRLLQVVAIWPIEPYAEGADDGHEPDREAHGERRP